MSMQKKYSRKSLSFLTPQSRKIQSSQARLSFSSNDPPPENVLGNLLNDPLKRALLVEVLSQDLSKNNQNGVKNKTERRFQKYKYESPTALCRRRALAKMQGNSDSSDTSNYNRYKHLKVPFEQILKGVIAYVEIMSQGKDRTSGVKSLMQAMGADIRDVFSRDLTHVVFKDGSFRTYQKAKLLKVHLVSVLWVDAARRHQCRMPEKHYPAIGSNASNANVSLICQQFQKEYEDVLQEELSKMSILPDINSEDIITSSQNCASPSLKSLKKNTNNKHFPVTPNSMYLNSTPDITSDSDSENCFITNNDLSMKHKDRVIEDDVTSMKNLNIHTNTEDEPLNLNNKLTGTGSRSQSDEISPLRISSNSGYNTSNSSQHVLNYKNVTLRKKNTKNKVTILEQHIVTPNIFSTTEHNCNKKLEENGEKNYVQQKSSNPNISSSLDYKNKGLPKKPVRKLFNVDDSIIAFNQNNKLKDVSKVTLDYESTENNVQCSNIANDNSHGQHLERGKLINKSCWTTPKNLKKKSSSKMKESATTPRRKSARLFQFQNNDSPQKRLRRNSLDENTVQCNTKITESDQLTVKGQKGLSNLNVDSAESDRNNGKILKNGTINKTTPKNYKISKILNFTPSSISPNGKLPLNNDKVIQPSLEKDSAIGISEDEIHDNSHSQTKYSHFAKPRRRSLRISSLRNTSTTSNLKSSITPQKNPNMEDVGNLNNDVSNSSILFTSEENQKSQQKNVDSSDEFISDGIRKTSKCNNDSRESIVISVDESTSKKRNSKYVPSFIERNIINKKQSHVENSRTPTRRSTLDFMSKEPVRTQIKSKTNTPNSKLKNTPHSKLVKKSSIVCTRFHSTEVQVFQQIVKKLGIFFVEDEVTEKTTHLVVAESKRTVNLLRAIARGCWILKSEWLYRSLEADQWLPEEDFELSDFSDAIQKSRQERQAFGPKFSMDIFQNCGRIYISRGTNPRCSDLQELVTLCKGTVTTITRNADIVVGEYIEGKSCVTVNWIMDCITFYKRKSLKNYVIDPLISD